MVVGLRRRQHEHGAEPRSRLTTQALLRRHAHGHRSGRLKTRRTKVGYITVPAPPVANFTSDVQNGSAPLTVQFTDTSTGNVTSYLWDFGDGNTAQQRTRATTTRAPATMTSS